MSKIVYKCVRHKAGHYISALTTSLFWQVEYVPGEWVEAPRDSYIFAFDTLHNATDFALRQQTLLEVWQAEAEDARRAWPLLLVPQEETAFSIFWSLAQSGAPARADDGKRLHSITSPLMLVPPGTLLVKRIKLLKRVDRVDGE